MTHRKTTTLLNIDIDLVSLSDLIDKSVNAAVRHNAQICFACANPHSLVIAQSDPDFKDALLGSDIVVADGTGVTMMSRMVRVPIGPRIAGEDFFLGLMRALNRNNGMRVFFFGSSEHVLTLIQNRMKRDFPNVEVCGTLSPPFRDWSPEENQRLIQQINTARPDVLWVGMTAPKQEKWVHRNRHQLTAPVIGSIGAVFDFFAETHPRAPKWMCRIGLEWLYRLVREPRRMWRRNFVSTPAFIWLVLSKHLFSQWRRQTAK